MRYKVAQTETIEYVLEAANEEEAWEFLQSNTTRELRACKHDIKTHYSADIVEKTVMPADFHYDDDIPEILDDIPEELLHHCDENEEELYSISLEAIPFN